MSRIYTDYQSTIQLVTSALCSRNVRLMQALENLDTDFYDQIKQIHRKKDELYYAGNESAIPFIQYMYELFRSRNDPDESAFIVQSILKTTYTKWICRYITDLSPMILEADINWNNDLKLLSKCTLDIFEQIVNRHNICIDLSNINKLMRQYSNPVIFQYYFTTYSECQPQTEDDIINMALNVINTSIMNKLWRNIWDNIFCDLFDDVINNIDPIKYSHLIRNLNSFSYYQPFLSPEAKQKIACKLNEIE